MDPSLLVDPNLILDYGASFKDDSLCNAIDPLMDLINYNDTQLENIILNSDFCGGEYDNPWAENEFEDLLKDIVLNQVQPSEPTAEIVPAEIKSELSPCVVSETDVANYEEVYACSDESESVSSESTELDNFDTESAHSYCTESSSSTRKRKLSGASTSSSVSSAAPKRRKTRRSKRVQDDKVKNQNKVAAMKYRKKKKDEKDGLDEVLEAEEEKNRKLKASVEELKVNIDVLKELLGKYLSPSQLKAKPRK